MQVYTVPNLNITPVWEPYTKSLDGALVSSLMIILSDATQQLDSQGDGIHFDPAAFDGV